MLRRRGAAARSVVAIVSSLLIAVGFTHASSQAAPIEPAFAPSIAAIGTDAACLDGEEIAFLGEINAYRTTNGLAPLTVTQTLTAASEHHSLDMAATGHFDHVMSDGTTVEQNAKMHGYGGAMWGENIAAGTSMSTGAQSFVAWRNSPDHNANMLSGSFGAIGISREYNAASQYGWYWTTIFGDVADAAARSCDGSAVPNPAPPAPPIPTPAPTPAPSTGQSATATDDLNLRAGAGTSFAVLTVIPAGSTVSVTGAANAGFYPVTYAGISGWSSADFLGLGAANPPPTAPAPAPAPTGTATTLTDLNLRAGPSTADAVLLVMPPGVTVNLLGESSGGFSRVEYAGTTGWAFADYLGAPGSGSTPPSSPPPASGAGYTTTTDLNLRAGPGTTFAVVTVIPAGVAVEAIGGSENGFVSVRYAGVDGWAAADYLAGAVTPPAGDDGEGGGAVTTTDLNLRAGPSTADAVLTVLPAGTPVTITGAGVDGFVPVTSAGTTGWVYADYLG